MPKKNEEEGQEFFMRLDNPNTFRRNLLEASKMTLSVIKQTHKVSQIRELKHEVINTIAKEVKELKLLVQKAEELMPNYNKAELKKYFPEPAIPKEQPAIKTEKSDYKPKPKAPSSEMDKITRAIEDIQKKLQSL
ncbi:hypothetical protein JW756_02415 [Candidatus Woesearchaeota archaeon]|nr:hypothetical protein [Candidatus Woesearchaeota archaeon]